MGSCVVSWSPFHPQQHLYMRENGTMCSFGIFSVLLSLQRRNLTFSLKHFASSNLRRAMWGIKKMNGESGFPDPKPTKTPVRQGETQEDQNWPHHSQKGQKWPSNREKNAPHFIVAPLVPGPWSTKRLNAAATFKTNSQSLASRKCCDFENAEMLQFLSAPQKIAVIFYIFFSDFLAMVCDFCNKLAIVHFDMPAIFCDCDFWDAKEQRQENLWICWGRWGRVTKSEVYDRHRVNGVGRGRGQAVFNQILTRFPGIRLKSG